MTSNTVLLQGRTKLKLLPPTDVTGFKTQKFKDDNPNTPPQSRSRQTERYSIKLRRPPQWGVPTTKSLKKITKLWRKKKDKPQADSLTRMDRQKPWTALRNVKRKDTQWLQNCYIGLKHQLKVLQMKFFICTKEHFKYTKVLFTRVTCFCEWSLNGWHDEY